MAERTHLLVDQTFFQNQLLFPSIDSFGLCGQLVDWLVCNRFLSAFISVREGLREECCEEYMCSWEEREEIAKYFGWEELQEQQCVLSR